MHSMNWIRARRAAAKERETLRRWRQARILAILSFRASMPSDDPPIAELAALRAEVEGLRDKLAFPERVNINLAPGWIVGLA
jgi:hypothetical protein